MKTKKLLVVFLTVLLLSATQKTQASHISGQSLTYQYVGINTYLIRLKIYRDCSGIWPATSTDICYYSSSTGYSGTITCNAIPGTGNEIFSAFCFPTGTSNCTGGPTLGIQEWVYEGLVVLPAQASDWIFSFNQCCLNIAVNTLQNSGMNGMHISAQLNNLNNIVSSSPQFINSSYAMFCINTLSIYSQPAIDPDGDSLVYILGPVVESTYGCPDTTTFSLYLPPYSPTYPIHSSTPLVFDPSTGIMTFTPDILQTGMVNITVQEYRNGILIGEAQHQEQMYIVANGVINPNWMKGKVFIDQNSNAVYDSGEPEKQGVIIEVQPANVYCASNYYGDYQVPLNPGTYMSSIPTLPYYYTVTPSINTANFTGAFQTDLMNDFALTAIPNIQDLRVTLTGSNVIQEGTNSFMYLHYKNVGTTTVPAGSVSLAYDTNFVFINSTVPPDTVSGNTLTWTFSNLSVLAGGDIYLEFYLPATVAFNTQLTSVAEILPITGDTVPQDNSDILNQLVSFPVDPNRKTVSPPGPITTSQVANGIFLEYTIYFQNTGTDTAINVFVTDTLHTNFDIPTFEVLSASHNYTWSLTGQGIIDFTFNNIMLPDSGTNQLLSNGFIKYRIQPKNNLIQGDKVTNTAYIVFDSFAPLATNSTSTTVINAVTVNEVSPDITGLLIYPNPANEVLNIEMNLKEATTLNIQLFNLLGELVKQTANYELKGLFKKQIEINDLSRGVYFLKIATSKGMKIAKIVKD